MKTILSIDPALKNLAITKITFDDDNTIIDIDVKLVDIMKIKKPSFEKLMSNLKLELDKLIIEDVDSVIIENQPSRMNMRVKSVAIAIYTYFMINNKHVAFVSPSIKLTNEENKLTYKERKNKSVEKTFLILNDHLKETINTFKKKDDICDCILMASRWIERSIA